MVGEGNDFQRATQTPAQVPGKFALTCITSPVTHLNASLYILKQSFEETKFTVNDKNFTLVATTAYLKFSGNPRVGVSSGNSKETAVEGGGGDRWADVVVVARAVTG